MRSLYCGGANILESSVIVPRRKLAFVAAVDALFLGRVELPLAALAGVDEQVGAHFKLHPLFRISGEDFDVHHRIALKMVSRGGSRGLPSGPLM